MDRFGPTGKVSKKQVHLLRWSSFPGRTGLNFGWTDRAPGFNSLASTMIELSANETKWSSLVARIRALILMCRVEYLISGPKNYRDFRETGPWAPVGCNVAVVSSRIVLPLLQPPWHRANSVRKAKLMHAARQLPGKPRNQDNRNTCKAPK